MKITLIRKPEQTTPDWVRPKLEQAGFELIDRQCNTPQEVVEIAADADIVWDMGGVDCITAEILHQLASCGAIIRGGSGTDNIPVARATELGIIVANTPDATSVPVAEHTVALILSVTRKIAMHESGVRDGQWAPTEPLPEMLFGKTIGLVGFGRIARNVAERLLPFGVSLLAFDPLVAPEAMAERNVEAVDLPELLAASDIVSVHTPLLDSTRHLIGKEELARMKPTAFLINTSRGPVVDTQALVPALRDGVIAGAALDVLEAEPPEDDPLIGMPNVIVTPHSASFHARLIEDFCRLAVETAIDLSQKRWPVSYVNPQLVPRWDMPPKY